MDQANFLERLLEVLDEHEIRYCVVGGQAVNAYVEPLVSLDLALVVAAEQLEQIEALLSPYFRVERFAHGINLSTPDSALRVQIQTDLRYAEFLGRAAPQEVLGVKMPVARVDDVMQGKVWAVQDPDRRASKRQKDLADISRLLEAYPELDESVPQKIRSQLLKD